MIRIMIDWEFISPALGVVSGIATIHHQETVDKWTELTKFKVKKEHGTTGYQSLDGKGIPSVLLDAIKPQLDIMLHSFHNGVMLEEKDFCWIIEEDLDDAREKLRNLEIKEY